MTQPQKLANEIGNSKRIIKRRAWPEKRRAQQAEIIHRTKPWRKATGPRTQSGKDKSKMNARKHGFRDAGWRALRTALAAHRRFLKFINETLKIMRGRSKQRTYQTAQAAKGLDYRKPNSVP